MLMFYIAGEEMNDNGSIVDLAAREADAPIYIKPGFTYGRAVRLKIEFRTNQKSHNGARPPSFPALNPTMADLSTFTPEIRQLYLSK